MDANNNPDLENDMSHRHTPYQIQQLEAFFRQCPHPDVNQRTQIARGLGLDLNQVTSWFHNKWNQRKALHHPAENNALQTENHSVCDEIQAFSEQEKLPNEVTIRTAGGLHGRQSKSSFVGPDIAMMNFQNLKAASRSIVINEMEKEVMKKNAYLAFKELSLLYSDRWLWKRSMTNRGYVLNREEYFRRFPESSYMQRTGFRFESSKDSTVVPLKASDLARMFLDMKQWADLFPTIVNEANILKSLDTGIRRAYHLIYGRMHILSPLVVPREFIFIRHCVQTSPTSWFIVDESYNSNQAARGTLSWRYPSGVRIESLPDTKSKVTWVEHVKVNGSIVHPLYRDLLSTSHGYGATRWLSTLKRMSERSLYSRSTCSHVHEEGMGILEGREYFMTFSLRMIRDFCSVLSMPGNLSESSNPNVRMSARNNNEPGKYRGMIVAASTSIRLPLNFENLFNFLRDASRRPEWDVMNDRSSVNMISHFSTGPHHGDSISILQLKEGNALLLQESSIDPVGALVIFTLVSLPKLKEIAKGADTSNIPILPCGFLISSDGNGSDGASGSLLTLAFQWLGLDNTESTQKAVANHLDNILTSIIHDITVALGCPQLD